MQARSVAKLVPSALLIVAVLASCASRVWMLVPAKHELLRYERVGVVPFEGTDPALVQRATAELQQRLLEARPGLRLIELSSFEEGADLDAVFTGSLEVTKPRPTVGVTMSLVDVEASAKVLATLRLRLVEPETKVTLWIGSSQRTGTVGSAAFDSAGSADVRIADFQTLIGNMVDALTHDVTGVFRDTFLRRTLEQIPPGYEATYPDGVQVWVPPGSSQRP